MDIHEEAAFWKAAMLAGWNISTEDSPPLDDDCTWCKHIVMNIYVDGDDGVHLCDTIDEIVVHIKKCMHWEWTPDVISEVEEEVVAEMVRFNAFLLFDAGFGPQQKELGQVSAVMGDEWEEAIQQVKQEAGERAHAYVAEEHSDKKWADLNTDIKLHPVRD